MRENPSDILKRCGIRMRMLIELQDERETLTKSLYPRAIQYTHDKIKTHPEDYFGKTIAKVADLEIRIDHELGIVRRLRMESVTLIDTLKSAKQRYVLKAYYTELRTEGKHKTWYTLEDIANEMGLTTTAVKKIKQRGLNALDRHPKMMYYDIR